MRIDVTIHVRPVGLIFFKMKEKLALIIVGLGLLAFTSCSSNKLCPAYTDGEPMATEQMADNS